MERLVVAGVGASGRAHTCIRRVSSKSRLIAGFLAVIASLWSGTAIAAPKPYVVPHTQVLRLHSKHTGVNYDLFVGLPFEYRKTSKLYPVIYLLDADYSFALVRNIVQHFVEREDLPPVIIVAIAYPRAAEDRKVYRSNRTRDYTPVYAPDGGYGAEHQKLSGSGPKFRAFIGTELTPFIERKFRADASDRTIIGHSYGGLFASYVLTTEPNLFRRYIIVSPSLWYANRVVLSMMDDAALPGPQTRVFFAVGSEENQPENLRAMVDDLKDFVARLKRKAGPKPDLRLRIFDGETHNSVFPGAVTSGLRAVFDQRQTGPGSGP